MHRLRLQPLERRRQRQGQRQRRQRDVTREIQRATRSSPRRPAGRHHAADRQPSRARGHDDQAQATRGAAASRATGWTRAERARTPQPALPRAGVDAERDADERGERERGGGENGGVERASRRQIADRPRVEQRFAEVEPSPRAPSSRRTAPASGRRGRARSHALGARGSSSRHRRGRRARPASAASAADETTKTSSSAKSARRSR